MYNGYSVRQKGKKDKLQVIRSDKTAEKRAAEAAALEAERLRKEREELEAIRLAQEE